MSYILKFIFFLFLISCDTKRKNNSDKKIVNILDSTSYLLEIGNYSVSGTYKHTYKEVNTNVIQIDICHYKGENNQTILSKKIIDSLIASQVLFSKNAYGDSMYYYYNEQSKKKNRIRQRFYYQIWHKSDNIKISGKLYKIGDWRMKNITPSKNGGEIFISDTTQQYGWFVFQTPSYDTIHYGRGKFNLLEKPLITSTHPKAKVLYGYYDKISNIPHRLIRDEEVNKPNNKKNAKP